MSKCVTSVKGMNDILPSQMAAWEQVETALKKVMCSFAFNEIRFPVVEKTELFKRSIGDLTDIVQKEMYTFEDAHNGDWLTLRPEGTAACVRACEQNRLLYNQTQRLWYLGPMFRHERPQKGRYRQFYQFGVESFGFDGVGIELELLSINHKIWQALGLSQSISLCINTIGTVSERQTFQKALTTYLSAHKDQLDEESLMRLDKNPLRILDSKNPAIQVLLVDAPALHDYLSEDSLARFEMLKQGLDDLGITYKHEPTLVRGLDYYAHTVFEWVTEGLGAQGTVSAGGRYDGLVEQLGGEPTTAAGFAIGIERLVLLLEEIQGEVKPRPLDVYVVIDKALSQAKAVACIDKLRQVNSSLMVLPDFAQSSEKSQMKRAIASGAKQVMILSKETIEQDKVVIKSLDEDRITETIATNELENYFKGNG